MVKSRSGGSSGMPAMLNTAIIGYVGRLSVELRGDAYKGSDRLLRLPRRWSQPPDSVESRPMAPPRAPGCGGFLCRSSTDADFARCGVWKWLWPSPEIDFVVHPAFLAGDNNPAPFHASHHLLIRRHFERHGMPLGALCCDANPTVNSQERRHDRINFIAHDGTVASHRPRADIQISHCVPLHECGAA